MRLIDADALYRQFSLTNDGQRIPEKDCDNFPVQIDLAYIKQAIRHAPTIDAVPVVRCGECKFRNTSWYDKRDMLESFCRWDRDESPNDDDYCSYGEKMESEGGT